MTDSIFVSLVSNRMIYMNINSQQLADMIGMNHGALNAILAERVRMTLGVGLKLASVLEIELDPLIKIADKKGQLN